MIIKKEVRSISSLLGALPSQEMSRAEPHRSELPSETKYVAGLRRESGGKKSKQPAQELKAQMGLVDNTVPSSSCPLKRLLACLSMPEPKTAWLHFPLTDSCDGGGLPLIEESSEPSKEMSAKETHITHLP